jgi:hypothetical protein
MKILRNPIAVGILVIVALLLVFNNLRGTRTFQAWWRDFTTRPATDSTTSPAKETPLKPAAAPSADRKSTPARTASTQPHSEPAAESLPALDLSGLRASAARWIDSPRRDPFQGRSSGKDQSGPRAADVLTLHGVWRQTDSTLAIINSRVLSQGEIVQGYTVDHIETDRVWVEGPNGREPVEFKVPPPPIDSTAATNTASTELPLPSAHEEPAPDTSEPPTNP